MMLYTILPAEMLDTIIPEEVKQFTGYKQDYTLREAAFQVRELDNGYFLVSCKLCNAKYVANKCVETEMSEQEMAMAKTYYGEENIFTIQHDENGINRVHVSTEIVDGATIENITLELLVFKNN